jgi:hypothetical protein
MRAGPQKKQSPKILISIVPRSTEASGTSQSNAAFTWSLLSHGRKGVGTYTFSTSAQRTSHHKRSCCESKATTRG